MKNKLITIIIILSFFVPYMYAAGTVTVQNPTWLEEHFQRMTSIKQYWDTANLGSLNRLKNFMTGEHGEHARLILYIAFLYFFTLGVTDDVSKNLETYILMNPDPTKPEVLNVLNYFISNIQKLYILAIAATAFYMLFISLSPRQRAMSKYMLGKLVLGFLLVSISPYLLSLAYQFSEGMTAMILGQTDTRVVADEYNGMLWKCWWMTVGVIAAPVVFENAAYNKVENYVDKKVSTIKDALTGNYRDARSAADALSGQSTSMDELESLARQDAKKEAGQTKIGRVLQWMDRIKIKPQASFTFPFLMAAMLLIFGLYGFLALRYLMMMVWTVLFPLTIFFSSFELTKGLGRNMMEQTIFWLILQVFYAISLAVVSVGFALIPKGFEFFHIGPGDPFTFMTVSFFTLGGLLVFLLTPIFLLMMTQRRTA